MQSVPLKQAAPRDGLQTQHLLEVLIEITQVAAAGFLLVRRASRR
jgi:hypothetical protein